MTSKSIQRENRQHKSPPSKKILSLSSNRRLSFHKFSSLSYLLCILLWTIRSNNQSSSIIASAEGIISNDAEIPTPTVPPGLTIAQFTRLIFSEVDTEFHYNSLNSFDLTASQNHWEAATSLAWERALINSEVSGSLATEGKVIPFIICNTVRNKSGYERRNLILQEISPTTSSSGVSNVENIPMSPIYNRSDQTCFMTSLAAHIAARVSLRGILVQPMLYAMKLSKDSIRLTQEVDSFSNPILDVGLCPNISPFSRENEIKTLILDYLAIDPDTRTSKIEKDLYWKTSTDPFEEGIYWINNLQKSQNNELCPLYYRKLLIEFTSDRSTVSASDDTPFISIAFPNNIGGIGDSNNHSCIMTLFLGISLLPQFCSIQAHPKVQLFGKEAQWITQSNEVDRRPFFEHGIRGNNQIVGVSDSGLDLDHCYFIDEKRGKVRTNAKPDAAQRKVVYYDSFGDDADVKYGHGTHVCGTISGMVQAPKSSAGEGIAPDSKIAFVDIRNEEKNELRIPPIDRLMIPRLPNAKIHTMAWGTDYPYYGFLSRNLDSYMHNSPEILLVVAAGNSDDTGDLDEGSKMMSDPATSKNALVVGASENNGDAILPSQRGKDYLVSYSMRGPTNDGRTKPDVVAPGSWILSAGSMPSSSGECDPSAGNLPKPGLDPGRQGLLYREGTSMSAAVAAGNAALVRQYFEEGFWPTGKREPRNRVFPSGALVKAILMNGAQTLLGIDQMFSGVSSTALYDGAQNFGRINLLNSLHLQKENKFRTGIWDNQVLDDQENKTYTIKYSRANGCRSRAMSITLVWMDPPGVVGCRSCVLNDLDVSAYIKKRPETIYYPNGFRNNPETINNAERIFVGGLRRRDKVIVTVKASNLVTPFQRYALVATGCIQLNDFYEDVDNTFQIVSIALGFLFLLLGICFFMVFCIIRWQRKL